jgi:hypothetical protein
MLEELEWQHPAMFKFIRQGGKGTYEQQLLADFDADLFSKASLDTEGRDMLARPLLSAKAR